MDFGGAGKSAYRLHKGMQVHGVDSSMFVLSKKTVDTSVRVISPLLPFSGKDPWGRLFQHWNKSLTGYPQRPEGLEIFTDTICAADYEACREIEDADIVNLHWMAGFLNHADVAFLFRGKKVVWTLHDMNPFTGGCHYTGACTGYLGRCGSCPQLGSGDIEDLSARVWSRKEETYRELDLTIVTPSQWLGSCSSSSSLFGRFDHHVIPYGLPLDVFKPMDRNLARAELGLPGDSKVVLFGADSSNRRKGFPYLIEALKHLNSLSVMNNIAVAVFGPIDPAQDLESGYPTYTFNYIKDEQVMASLYSAADVFVLPSLEDNLPNTVIESFSCGTPVAAFSIGGVPDMIDHGVTGYLAPAEDVVDLANGIKWCMNDAPLTTRRTCRTKAEERYALETQGKNYIDLYDSILSMSQA
jgi:glycosyltransferase involved in cell wall biosynthesis